MTDGWRVGALAYSRLLSHRRLVDRTRAEIERACATCDPWYVSVSGGKDSTVLLHLVGRSAGTVDVIHGEEEFVAPGTHEYLQRLALWPGVRLHRVAYIECGAERNGTEFTSWAEEPYLRPLPADMRWFESKNAFLEWARQRWRGAFVGTRRDESSRRDISYRVRGSLYAHAGSGIHISTPLHGWQARDVWAYLIAHEVPYHPGYDAMRAIGMPEGVQRIGPVADDRALRWNSVRWWRMVWPEEYMRVIGRHPWIGEHG